eukprot:TRINITY_DN1622_c0_g1_i2.p1 TRINITY_DN1622_c0_g1~~TRINITY_DN1622_c0_g1_i2.p1  ORF type:complete len:130 (+),score=1.59 TRINITY_DN1622_c0_g1_i2:183-572(+)
MYKNARRKVTLRPRHFYLDLEFHFDDKSHEESEITPVQFQYMVHAVCQDFFGVVGASFSPQVISLRGENGGWRGIIRVTHDVGVAVWGALSLTFEYEGKPCRCQVWNASPWLASLAHSRTVGEVAQPVT